MERGRRMCELIFGLLSIGLLGVLGILFLSKDDIHFMEFWLNESISKYRK